MRSTSTASSTTSCGQKALHGGNRKKKKHVTNVCVSVSSYICQSVTELSGLTAILVAVPFLKCLIGILNNFLFLYSQFSLIPFFPSHPFILLPSSIWNPIIACYWAVPGIINSNIPFICFHFCSSDIFSKVPPSLFISLVFSFLCLESADSQVQLQYVLFTTQHSAVSWILKQANKPQHCHRLVSLFIAPWL